VYSTIIFVGWIAVITVCIAQRVWRTRGAMAAAAVAGLLALVVAHSLAAGGIIQSMRFALDASFWAAAVCTAILLSAIGGRLAGVFARGRARGTRGARQQSVARPEAMEVDVVTTI
jgi:uncharacterized protein involved in response to NO